MSALSVEMLRCLPLIYAMGLLGTWWDKDVDDPRRLPACRQYEGL